MLAIKRDDEHHRIKHQKILSMIKNDSIQTVFFGDSLVRRWEEHPELWQSYFSSFSPANFGIGGDRLENMKWRLLNGELDGFTPKALVFLGGTNNLGDQSVAQVTASIKEIITLVQERQPATKIILLGLLPRNPDHEGKEYDQKILSINEQLSRWADPPALNYLDLGPLLSSDNKRLENTITEDGLHLNKEGYRRIGPTLQQLIGNLFTQ